MDREETDLGPLGLALTVSYLSLLALASFSLVVLLLEFETSLPLWTNEPASRRLLLLALSAAVLGATASCLRNFALAWRLNDRRINANRLAGVLFRPFSGALMGLLVFLALRAGILKPTAPIDVLNPYTAAVIAGVAGIWSEYLFVGLVRRGERLALGRE